MSLIRSTFTTKGHLLDDLAAYVSSFQESVNQTLAEVTEENKPDILDELSFNPPPSPYSPDNPVPWTSLVQASAFHASGGFGGGIPHERTDAIPDGWVVTNDGNGHTVIANPVPGALFVYGSLAKTNPGLHQQAFLALIGWPQGYATVKFWTDALAEEVMKRIDQQFKDLGSVTTNTRAYSRR